jgi:hypothetical protein
MGTISEGECRSGVGVLGLEMGWTYRQLVIARSSSHDGRLGMMKVRVVSEPVMGECDGGDAESFC